jgi:hypothetical protein
LLAVVVVGACAGNTSEVERARKARYDADRGDLIRRTAAEVSKHYGTLSIEQDGTIMTAWHQVQGGPSLERANERRFIRFVVTVSTERPGSLEVAAYAAKWETGMALPTELHGADKPAWLEPRADRLRIQIHDVLEQYAR